MIQKDKFYHAIACFLIAIIGGFAIAIVGGGGKATFVGGVLTAMACGIGKEYGDKNAKGNHWCWYDLVADAIGAVVGAVVIAMV